MKAIFLTLFCASCMAYLEIRAAEPDMESKIAKAYLPEAESAQLNREEKAETEACWREVLVGINRIVIHSQLPPREKYADTAIVEKSEVISQLISNLKPALSKRRWPKPGLDLKELGIVEIESYCQCLGEFRFVFFSGKRVVAEITVHHGKHIRSKVLGDRDLEENSMRKLYALANWMLPMYRVDPWVE